MFRIIPKMLVSVAAISAVVMSLAAPSVSAHSNNNQACVDGNNRANFSVTWNATDSISVKTLNNKLLCNDVTLWFSSYTLPDNYNGQGFTNNPTATPQTVFDSSSVVLKKGTTGATTFKIKLPEACKHMQVDLYYGPEITRVTAAGHGVQYITGKILSKTQDTCTPVTPEEPPVIPEVPPTEAETPPTPAPVVNVPQPQPVELPHTGASMNTVAVATAVTTAVGYTVAQAVNKRR